MSEKTNTEIIQEGYQKFGTGDITGLLELFDDNIEWETLAVENAPYTGAREGKQAVAEFFKLLNDSEEITRFEPLEFIAENDRVVVLGEAAATVRSTGREYETPWVHIFNLKDGKVTEFQEFQDSAVVTRAYQKSAAA
jgi:ketosteroid isomerase-like protein